MADYWIFFVLITGVAFGLLTWAGLYIADLETSFQEYQTTCEEYQDACSNALNVSDKLIKEYKNYTTSLLNQIEILQNNLTNLQTKYNNLVTNYSRLKENNSQLQEENQNLKNQKGLINPTFWQLWDFIIRDDTEQLEWDENFDCTEFSNHFIKNFAEKGFFACATEISFDDDTGHIIVAINTTDRGLFYVEPQTDYLIDSEELKVGEDYCDIVNWNCDDWIIKKISSCFELKV